MRGEERRSQEKKDGGLGEEHATTSAASTTVQRKHFELYKTFGAKKKSGAARRPESNSEARPLRFPDSQQEMGKF